MSLLLIGPWLSAHWNRAQEAGPSEAVNVHPERLRRVWEHEVVDGRKALSTTWRGSFSLLAAVMKISAHMVGLQERMKGPRYDVFGPWPVCPPHIAAQYP